MGKPLVIGDVFKRGSRQVQVCGDPAKGPVDGIYRDFRGRVAVRNLETNRLSYVPERSLIKPVRTVKLGVIEFHPQTPLRQRFYHVVDDLRAAGCIVDLWLMDIASVLKEFGYTMTVTTDKDKLR
ncbi:MAG TPA: hypothetical protein VF491_17640 [Vicinamibacterales bacterium]